MHAVKFSIDNVDRHMPPDLDKPIDSYPAMCIIVQLVMALLTRVCKAFPLDGACTGSTVYVYLYVCICMYMHVYIPVCVCIYV